MHQHPAHAPRGPKSCSKSGQRWDVSGLQVSFKEFNMMSPSKPEPPPDKFCTRDHSAID
jgi:hypothetical protein